MWQVDFAKGLFNAARKTVKTQSIPRVFGRAIKQTGNGMRRQIISGFGGPNLDENHFKLLNYYAQRNIRPIIAGFTGPKNSARYITAQPGRAIMRFFPNFQMPKMQRHVVFNVETKRIAVKGFTDSAEPGIKIVSNGTPGAAKIAAEKVTPATERVVIQGFGGNSAEKIMKPIDRNSPRTFVKGFNA